MFTSKFRYTQKWVFSLACGDVTSSLDISRILGVPKHQAGTAKVSSSAPYSAQVDKKNHNF